MVQVRVVALPRMVLSRAGDYREPRAQRPDRHPGMKVQARWCKSPRKRKSPTPLTLLALPRGAHQKAGSGAFQSTWEFHQTPPQNPESNMVSGQEADTQDGA